MLLGVISTAVALGALGYFCYRSRTRWADEPRTLRERLEWQNLVSSLRWAVVALVFSLALLSIFYWLLRRDYSDMYGGLSGLVFVATIMMVVRVRKGLWDRAATSVQIALGAAAGLWLCLWFIN
jgi:hypothetical protein